MAKPQRSTEPQGLFLDGSGFIGWALMGVESMTLTDCGTFTTEPIAPGVWGVRWLRTATFLERKIIETKPVLIGFEAPFIPPPPPRSAKARAKFKGFRVNADTLRFLIGVCACFEMVAARHGLPCREVNVATVKASLAGAAKKEERDRERLRMQEAGAGKAAITARMRELMKIGKIDMKRACWERGWEVKDDHQADACGVGKVMIEGRWAEGGKRNDGHSKRRRGR